MTFLLTDDEIAALAAEGGRAWLAPLPTVDDSQAADLMRAVLRGRRSIAARNSTFVGTDGATGTLAEIRDLVSPAVGMVPQLTAYVANRQSPEILDGISLSVFPVAVATDRLVVVTTSDGINDVSVRTRDEAEELVRALIADIRSATDGTRVVTVVRPRPDGRGVLIVVDGETTTMKTYEGGTSGPATAITGIPEETFALV